MIYWIKICLIHTCPVYNKGSRTGWSQKKFPFWKWNNRRDTAVSGQWLDKSCGTGLGSLLLCVVQRIPWLDPDSGFCQAFPLWSLPSPPESSSLSSTPTSEVVIRSMSSWGDASSQPDLCWQNLKSVIPAQDYLFPDPFFFFSFYEHKKYILLLTLNYYLRFFGYNQSNWIITKLILFFKTVFWLVLIDILPFDTVLWLLVFFWRNLSHF